MRSQIIPATEQPGQGDQAKSGAATMRKRIGSTVFDVTIYFDQNAKETMNEKILRLIENDLNLTASNAMLYLPQTGRLPETSSL